jgi:exodeoxyribonuclease VII small subunit
MTTAKRKSAKTTDWNYETTVGQIEEILALIEGGEMGLSEVFEQFGVAVAHLQQCESFLGDRRSQVDLLIETLAQPAEEEF